MVLLVSVDDSLRINLLSDSSYMMLGLQVGHGHERLL